MPAVNTCEQWCWWGAAGVLSLSIHMHSCSEQLQTFMHGCAAVPACPSVLTDVPQERQEGHTAVQLPHHCCNLLADLISPLLRLLPVRQQQKHIQANSSLTASNNKLPERHSTAIWGKR